MGRPEMVKHDLTVADKFNRLGRGRDGDEMTNIRLELMNFACACNYLWLYLGFESIAQQIIRRVEKPDYGCPLVRDSRL